MRCPWKWVHRLVSFPHSKPHVGLLTIIAVAGIPATDPPAVIALTSQTIKKGYITLPPNDVPMPVIYNPATVDSSNRMWYAVNPSYTWIQGFSVWCETNGNDVQLQVMLPTNYAAISIWRVKYSGGACTIDMMGTHVCANDVAVMIPLDITNNMPTLGRANGGKETKLSARLCSTSVKFNLWVEQLEYFDDLNIVATVRRGSVKTLASLLWVQDKRDQGVLVHYFINTLNVSQVREGTPWQADEQAVCPALRFLPSVGTFIAKSLESSVQLIRMPINVLMNPPAVESLLRFRASGQCPAETHGHSAYANCGNGLLALDPYFEALYAANEAFWGIVAWVAAQITLPDANAQTEFAKFLTGVATYGEATQVLPFQSAYAIKSLIRKESAYVAARHIRSVQDFVRPELQRARHAQRCVYGAVCVLLCFVLGAVGDRHVIHESVSHQRNQLHVQQGCGHKRVAEAERCCGPIC